MIFWNYFCTLFVKQHEIDLQYDMLLHLKLCFVNYIIIIKHADIIN